MLSHCDRRPNTPDKAYKDKAYKHKACKPNRHMKFWQ
jgi:hypothetical protein